MLCLLATILQNIDIYSLKGQLGSNVSSLAVGSKVVCSNQPLRKKQRLDCLVYFLHLHQVGTRTGLNLLLDFESLHHERVLFLIRGNPTTCYPVLCQLVQLWATNYYLLEEIKCVVWRINSSNQQVHFAGIELAFCFNHSRTCILLKRKYYVYRGWKTINHRWKDNQLQMKV